MRIYACCLTAVIVAVLSFSFISCSKGSTEPEPQPPTPPGPVEPTPLPIYYGNDTLLGWQLVIRDEAASFNYLQFPTKDSGYVTDNNFGNITRFKRSKDGGKTWTEFQGMPSEAEKIQFVSSKVGFASVPRIPLWPETGQGGLWQTGNSGLAWGRVFLSDRAYTTTRNITFPTDTVAYAVTVIGEVLRIRNYKTYSAGVSNLGIKTTTDAFDIAFADLDNGWLTAGAFTSDAGSAQGGIVLNTKDKGVTWTKQLEDRDVYFRNITFPDKDRGYVSTMTNYIYRTSNGGNPWTKTTITKSDNSRVETGKMLFVTPQRGFMISTNEILETTDSGATWKRSCKDGKDLFRDITFTAPNILWATTKHSIYKLTF